MMTDCDDPLQLTRRHLLAAGAASAGTLVLPTAGIAQTPIKGGTLRCACSRASASGSLDPLRAASGIDYVRCFATFNRLVRLGDDLTTEPELAVSIEPDNEARNWTVTLREEVTFADGSPMSADDVIWTLERIRNEGEGTLAAERLGQATWRRVGDHEIVLSLPDANRDFPRIFGTPQFSILKAGETDFANPAGTGPFRMSRFEPTGGSTHQRRDAYWRRPAYLETIELSVEPDPLKQTSMLLDGDIEMADELPPVSVSRLQYATTVRLHKVPSGQYFAIVCRRDRGPGRNRDFVLALKYLQRRDLIDRTVLYAASELGNDQPIGSAYGADHCEALSKRRFDRSRAYHHLSKSKVRKAEITYSAITPGAAQIVKRLQREADKIGLTIKLTEVPVDDYPEAMKEADIFVTRLPMRVSALEEIAAHYLPDSPENFSRWYEPKMLEHLTIAQQTSDPAVRHDALCQMQLLISNDAGVIIPVHSDNVSAHRAGVHGVSRSPLSSMGGGDWPERAWIAF